VYGRLPHGPLAVLRDMWLNESDFPNPKNKSTVEYLKELRERLATAMSFAQSYAEKAPQRYVLRYNARCCSKSFEVGEPVLVLQKDTTASKVFSRWIGPVVITHIQSPQSYVVEFEDGSKRTIHANHLRKFHTRAQSVTYDTTGLSGELGINSCAIVSEQDSDFGDLHVYDSTINKASDKLPSEIVDKASLSHLTQEQQCELLQLLDKYADCFSDQPGLTNRAEHTIDLVPGFKPRRMQEYKVPECLKHEVERQLDQMLTNGVVKESNSPMASPLVCVLKGKGGCNGVRLAVDYRYVNSYTVGDAFPIPGIEDVIQKVGAKRFISTFDCRQGYWQTPVTVKDRWLTAFVCMVEFTRTPFGLKNAGQTFVRAMQAILR